jgi:sugar phosphate isomerase/epimerase
MLSIGSNLNEVRIDGSLAALRHDLESFRTWGLTAAELSPHGLDVIRNGRLDPRRMAEVQAILRDFSFCYSVHAPNPINLMDEEPELHADALRATLEFAVLTGARVVVCHPGRFQAEESFHVLGRMEPDEKGKAHLLEQESGLLQKIADAFPEIIIGLENARPYKLHSPYCYAEIPSRLGQQVAAIGRPNVRITLDFGHLNMAARFYGFDPVAEAAAVAPLIVHCHLHDNFGRAVYATERQQTHQVPLGKGDSHMPVGWGNIDFDGIAATFLNGYEGLLITELRPRYFDATPESVRAIEGLLRRLGRDAP